MLKFGLKFNGSNFSVSTVNIYNLKQSYSSISSVDGKTLFCLISKNGCTTITCNVAGIIDNDPFKAYTKLRNRIFSRQHIKNFNSYEEIIAIYRDPIDRFISLCNHIKYTRSYERASKLILHKSKDKLDFINNVLMQCVISNAFKNNEHIDQHVVSQTRFLEYIGVLNDPRLKIYPINQLQNVLESRGYNYSNLNNSAKHYVTKEDLSEHIINQIKYTYEKDYELERRCEKNYM